MDFAAQLDEQREYRDRARAVAAKRLLPDYQARERAGRIDAGAAPRDRRGSG